MLEWRKIGEVNKMDIWILVIALLVIAIIFFVSSLFAKQPGQDDLKEQVDSQGEQIRNLQRQVNELEEDLFETQPVESVTAEEVYYANATTQPESQAFEAEVEPDVVTVEEAINYQIPDQTREEIIRLYSQGYTLNEIAEEVDEELVTVQYFIDEYIENR